MNPFKWPFRWFDHLDDLVERRQFLRLWLEWIIVGTVTGSILVYTMQAQGCLDQDQLQPRIKVRNDLKPPEG